MNQYVKGELIRNLREKQNMTQVELAEQISVSDKAVSKWETGRGFPDISLIEPLAKALGLSVGELFAGEQIINRNAVANMKKARIYVCPICGNLIQSIGEIAVSCCGIALPALEAETLTNTKDKADKFEDKHLEEHRIRVEKDDDELYVTVDHPMTKDHYISFIVYRTGNRIETVKLYPEGNAECRFFRRGHGELIAYCNHHGLFSVRV